MGARTVLVVDDNELNLKLMQGILKVVNCHMEEALDAQTGIEMAKSLNPDLIVMDVQLPKADGYEVTRRLKSENETKEIPIIIVTSFAMDGEKKEALAVGCDEYLSKPINIHQFIETIRNYLPDQG